MIGSCSELPATLFAHQEHVAFTLLCVFLYSALVMVGTNTRGIETKIVQDGTSALSCMLHCTSLFHCDSLSTPKLFDPFVLLALRVVETLRWLAGEVQRTVREVQVYQYQRLKLSSCLRYCGQTTRQNIAGLVLRAMRIWS